MEKRIAYRLFSLGKFFYWVNLWLIYYVILLYLLNSKFSVNIKRLILRLYKENLQLNTISDSF